MSFDDRTPQDRREVTFSRLGWYAVPQERRPLWKAHQTPDDQYEQLHDLMPFEEPETLNYGDTAGISSGLQHLLINYLTVKERSVVEMVVFGDMTLRECGEVLASEAGRGTPYSKQWVSRVRDRALGKLRNHLER